MKLPKSLPLPNAHNSKWPVIVRVVSGHSMVPVLPPGTYVWATQWFRTLRIGDVVIFFHNGKEKIKRISEIKENDLYVLGDHEESSTDSRHFGTIPRSSVIGKVFWPHAPKTRAEKVDADDNGQISPDK